MNKYKLDAHYLRRKLYEYEALYNKIDFNNISDRDLEIIDIIENFSFLFNNYNLKKQYNYDDRKYDFNGMTDKEIFDATFFYNAETADNNIDNYMSMLYKTFQKFESDGLFPFALIKINNDELLELTGQIVKSVNHRDFISYYNEVQKRTKYHIQYYNNRYFSTTGLCMYDALDFKCYCFLVRENSILDVITSVHETFHSIIYYYLAKINHDYAEKSCYLQEIEGFFADMIATYQLTSFPFFQSPLRCDIYDILKYSKNMLIGKTAEENFDQKGNINIEMVNYDLLKKGITNPNVTRDDIYKSINTSYNDNSSDCFAFLCACDLFHLYQSDKEKAIYELLEISKLTPDHLLNNLRKHSITFMDDDFSNFRSLSNKLLQKKKS